MNIKLKVKQQTQVRLSEEQLLEAIVSYIDEAHCGKLASALGSGKVMMDFDPETSEFVLILDGILDDEPEYHFQ